MKHEHDVPSDAPSVEDARVPLIALLVAGVLAALIVWCGRPPRAQGLTTPQSAFSAERAALVHAQVIGDEPHPTGSLANAAVRERIERELERLGLDPLVQETLACNRGGAVALVRNVIVRIPGSLSGKTVLLACHYDSVGAGPGAGDDGAGVASLLEIARALRTDARARRDIVLLFDDGEELGLIGARAFMDEHPWAADIGVVVNVEARGTSGPSMMFETSEENARLIDVLRGALERPSAISAAYEIYKRMPNDTDLTVFKEHGLAGYNFAFVGGLRHYHTALDDLAHLDRASLQHHGDNVLALARALATESSAAPRSGRAVYTDVLGRMLVAWDERVSSALAAGVLLLLVLGAGARLRSGACTLPAIAWGAFGAVLVLACAAAAGWLLNQALAAARGVPDAWAAHPLPLRVALYGATLASGVLGACAVARRAGFAGAWLGTWTLFALGALLLALFLPSTSYLLILPCALACCALWVDVLMGTRTSTARMLTLVLVPLAAGLCVWMPLVVGLEQGFELALGFALCALVALASAALVPAFVSGGSRARRASLRVALLAILVAFAGALFVPAYSREQPSVRNLAYIEDGARERAAWLVHAGRIGSASLALAFGNEPRAQSSATALAWNVGELEPAPRAQLRAPTLKLISERQTQDGGARTIRAQLASLRRAERIMLTLPAEVELRSIKWRDKTLRLGFPRTGTIALLGFDPQGVELELELRGGAARTIEVWDVARELPAPARAVLDTRPAQFVARGEGDVSVAVQRQQL